MSETRAAQAGQGGMVRIACINKSTDTEFKKSFDNLTAALQKCYDQYFVPVWGYPVKLHNTSHAGPSDWVFMYLDNADQADALGYHDLTLKGQPLTKVFVKTTQDAGEKVSVTACHELFEMAIDPVANLWSESSDGTLFAYEMCDAVEEDTFEVDGFEMSNFLHPSWFEPFNHPPGTKYDHLGLLTAPFTMTRGGYVITMKNGHVKQLFGSIDKETRFKKEDRKYHRSEYRRLDQAYMNRGRAAA